MEKVSKLSPVVDTPMILADWLRTLHTDEVMSALQIDCPRPIDDCPTPLDGALSGLAIQVAWAFVGDDALIEVKWTAVNRFLKNKLVMLTADYLIFCLVECNYFLVTYQ